MTDLSANRFLNLAGTPGSIVFQDSAGFFPVSLNDHENSYLNSSQRLDNILVTTYPGQNLGIADDNDAVPELKRNFQLATSHREHSRPLKSFSHTIEVKSSSHTIIHNKQSYLALVKATFKRLGSFRKPMPCKILKRNRAIEIIIIIIVIIITNKVN